MPGKKAALFWVHEETQKLRQTWFFSWHQERCSWERSRAVAISENSSLGVFTVTVTLHKLTFDFASILNGVTVSEKSSCLVPKENNKLEKIDTQMFVKVIFLSGKKSNNNF